MPGILHRFSYLILLSTLSGKWSDSPTLFSNEEIELQRDEVAF
jgi:hypothetical protein